MYTALFWTDDTYTALTTVTDTSNLGALSNYAEAIQNLPAWGEDGSLLNSALAFDPSWGTTTVALANGLTSGFGGIGSPQVSLQDLLFPS